MNNVQSPVIVIAGPTASGKTDFALKLAQYYPVEVISADSRQVYRKMDIGTAKVTVAEQHRVRHHLIDVVDPDKVFTVAHFVNRAHAAIADIVRRGKIPLIVGGTGLYIKALTEGLIDAPPEDEHLRADLLKQERCETGYLFQRLQIVDSALAKSLHHNDITRIVRGIEVYESTGLQLSKLQEQHAFQEQPYRLLKFAVSVDRPLLYDRINVRVDEMVVAGLISETQSLLDCGYSPELKAMRTIGYRQIIEHLCNDLSLNDAVEWIQRDSRRYAKRQLTWFRRDKSIIWVDYNDEFDTILKYIDEFNFNSMNSKGAMSDGKNTI